jgi:predicted nucleic acid-binding protein
VARQACTSKAPAAPSWRSPRCITVRSGTDVMVAAFCIENDDALLHRDRDFQVFGERRGLRGWNH